MANNSIFSPGGTINIASQANSSQTLLSFTYSDTTTNVAVNNNVQTISSNTAGNITIGVANSVSISANSTANTYNCNVVYGSTPSIIILPYRSTSIIPGSSGLTFALVSLQTGITQGGLFTQNDGGTNNSIVWMNDVTGNFARITYQQAPSGGTYGLRWGTSQTGHHQIYVKYDVRRSSNNCSKQCKIYGWGLINGGNTSNSTWGPTPDGYVGNEYGVYYGDNQTGGNDATTELFCTGILTGGGVYSRTPHPTFTTTGHVFQDTTGNVWETYEIFALFNDPGINNGEFALWKNGTLVFHAIDMFNCSDTTQDRGGLGLGEFSSSTNFHEDYRNLFVSWGRPTGRGI